MDSLDSSILEILLLCVIPLGIGLLVVLGIRGLPLSRRGVRSAIQMDGATFLRTDEANIRIRRRTVYLWFMIASFGLFALGWIALIAHGWAQRTSAQDLSAILGLGAVLLIVGSVLFVFIRLLGRPSVIQIDGTSRTITLGKGISQQRFLFSELRDVLRIMRGPVFHILIIMNDERLIAMGSVSGSKANSRAVDIVQQIAQVTGARIRES